MPESGETPALAVMVSGVYRAIGVIRHHLENSVLRREDLTWTGFRVLLLLCGNGELEAGRVAAEAGMANGTLTGVAKTLEARGLLERAREGRFVRLRLTERGDVLVRDLLPQFSDEQAFVTEGVEERELQELSEALSRVVVHLEANSKRRCAEVLGDAPVPPRKSRRGNATAKRHPARR